MKVSRPWLGFGLEASQEQLMSLVSNTVSLTLALASDVKSLVFQVLIPLDLCVLCFYVDWVSIVHAG